MPITEEITRPIAARITTPTRSAAAVRAAGSDHQRHLEEAIVRYQEAYHSENARAIESAYQYVCRLYEPDRYVAFWMKKYGWLFGHDEDEFRSAYYVVFEKVLRKWQPRSARPESHYGGSGDFKNYFWSALSRRWSNGVSFDSAERRNAPSRCPECDEMTPVLSTHVLEAHDTLLWERMAQWGLPIEGLEDCPFCKSGKWSRGTQEGTPERQMRLRRHIVQVHSSYLFDVFHEKYPNHPTLSPKTASINVPVDNGMGTKADFGDLYEFTPSEGMLNNLFSMDLTDLQQQIVRRVLNAPAGGLGGANFDSRVYTCSRTDFNEALHALREKMLVCGMAQGRDLDD